MRDRNHPAVFGWSVCNETLPVVINVFHAPKSIEDRQIQEINNWVKIVKKLDPSRDWISGDGEDMRPTDLPTVIGHYGSENSMIKWSSEGKPWGVGETGMAYYGTPKQIAVINGNRAYESQQGRMEGLATEAYDLISKQQKHLASYTSVFNLVWYGLKPLEFGMKDTLRAPQPEDGIFFTSYSEGAPGVQPERLGPYASTVNPGYDPNLPLYKPWPLFYAVQAINSSPPKRFSIPVSSTTESLAYPAKSIAEVGWESEAESLLKDHLTELGVPFTELASTTTFPLIIIEGNSPRVSQVSKQVIAKCIQSGGRVLILGVTPECLSRLNELLPYKLELTNRNATSFLKKNDDPVFSGLENKDFYFTERTKLPVMKYGLSGELVQHSKVLLEACNTDWARWNGQSENIKTASVLRSEREAKKAGNALVKIQVGAGEIYLTTIDLMLLKADGEDLTKLLLKNLGVQLLPVQEKSRKALSVESILERSRIVKVSDLQDQEPEKMDNSRFVSRFESAESVWKLILANTQGFLDFEKNSWGKIPERQEVYLSFWLYSPRSLVNLLVEPDMPKLNMTVESKNDPTLWINGTAVHNDVLQSETTKFENLPLEKGWNHLLLKVANQPDVRGWKARVKFESNSEGFLKQLNSSVGQ